MVLHVHYKALDISPGYILKKRDRIKNYFLLHIFAVKEIKTFAKKGKWEIYTYHHSMEITLGYIIKYKLSFMQDNTKIAVYILFSSQVY